MISFMVLSDGICEKTDHYCKEKYPPTFLTLQSRRVWKIRSDSDASHRKPGPTTGIKGKDEW